MKRRLSMPGALAILALLAGCSSNANPGSANTGGAAAAGASAALGGSGGLGSAGVNAAGAGVSGGGSGGPSTAGVGGAGPTAGTSGNSSAIPATFETVKLVLGGGGAIMPCAAAPCHGVGGTAPPGKPLELPPTNDLQLYANLTSYVSKACNNVKLVTPGNPAQSALLSILKGPCADTPRMPYGCTADAGDCIPDEYIAAVSQWIANGAPQR